MSPQTRDRFEERLLTELRAHVARNADAHTPARAPRRARRRIALRPRPIAAAGALLAAAAVAVVLASGGDGADPAYAVTPQSDGSVTVSVTSLDDAAGLQAALRDAGVNAVVRTVPTGKMCEPNAPAQAPRSGRMMVGGTSRAGGATTFTVSADGIRDGDALLITTSGDGSDGPSSISFAMVDGADTSCTIVDAPTPAPGAPDAGGRVTSGRAGARDAGPSTSVAP
jgi:hypothetical protein